jgi:hypothetical protein
LNASTSARAFRRATSAWRSSSRAWPQKKGQKGTHYISKRDEKETYYAKSALALEIQSLAKK